MIKTFLTITLTGLLLIGCGEQKNKRRSREKVRSKTTQQANQEKTLIDHETMFGIIKSIPSPLETSDLIKKMGIPFSERILHSPDKKSKYTTSDKQALNLGIYGADLGYTNIYGEKSTSFKYLKAVRQLAADLKIGQFFDKKTITRMRENENNMDSLVYISQRGFEQMSNYLEKQNRANVGAQLLIGGWIEGVYLVSSVYKTDPNDKLMETIGEQKVAMNEIMIIIDAFRKERNFRSIIKGFDELKTVYDEVEIEYIQENTEIEVAPGVMKKIEGEKSFVKITPQQIERITQTLESLREDIIN